MPLDQVQQRVFPVIQSSWSGGMITSLPPEELPDDAAAEILNFEFDDIGNLKARSPDESFTTAFTGKTAALSSLFRAQYSGGTVRYHYSMGTEVFRMDEDTSNKTNLTGAFSFPNGNRWYWVMYDDFAIGITGSATERPIKINSAGTASTLNANAPFACHGVVWNDRLWLVGVGANRNTIYGSAVNDPEDWTTTGDAGAITLGIDINDGDRIHAISVFRGNLIVYKRNKINVVSAISAPATLPSNLRVDVYTNNLGCGFPATIQNVLDDQVFLSDAGLASLSLAPLGDVKGAIISKKIAELSVLERNIIGSTEAINVSPFGFVVAQKQQYFLAVPFDIVQGGSSASDNTVWVLDYSDIAERDEDGLPKTRFSKFTGTIFGTAYCEHRITSLAHTAYLVAQPAVAATDTTIRLYNPVDNLLPYDGTVTKRLLTRAFHNGSPLTRSLWHRFGTTIKKHTSTVNYDINYYYDGYTTTKAGGYSITENNALATLHRTMWRQFKKNDSGRKANLVQIEITANTADQGFTVKSIQLEFTPLNYRRAKTSWVSD